MKKNKRVLVFGTFDLLHPGHCDFFQQAAQIGEVFAVVARDANVVRIKKRAPHENERVRLAKVARDRSVKKALLGDRADFLKPVEKIRPDIIALGFDQKTFGRKTLQRELKSRNLAPQIIRLKSYKPKQFKSSLLRNK